MLDTEQADISDNIDITVIVAAYNCEATLERAVKSVLRQVGPHLEVIVIDDASADGTYALAQKLALQDARVMALTTGTNMGPSGARNLGLNHARGEYVTVLDSDDFMAPGRLAALLSQARARGDDILADDLFKVTEGDEEGARTRLLGLPDASGTPMPVDLAEFVRGNMTSYNGARGEMGFLKPLISRDFLKRQKLTYHEDMRLGEDFALYAEALAAGAKFSIVPPAGYIAVVRPGSLSGAHGAKDLGALAARISVLRAAVDGQAEAALGALWVDTMKRYSWARLIDAVKARNIKEIAACFNAPPSVGLHLLGCLGEQVLVRGGKLLGNSDKGGVNA